MDSRQKQDLDGHIETEVEKKAHSLMRLSHNELIRQLDRLNPFAGYSTKYPGSKKACAQTLLRYEFGPAVPIPDCIKEKK